MGRLKYLFCREYDVTSELRVPSRTALVVVALLVVVSSGGYGLLVHDPAPASPASGPIPTDAPLDLAGATDDSAFSASVRFDTSSADGFSLRRRWAFDGSATVESITFDGGHAGTVGNVEYRTADATYRRYHAADPSAFESNLRSADGVVRIDEAAQVYYALSESRETPDGVTSVGLPLSTLSSVGFRRVGTSTYQGREVVEYAPRTGWTTYRHDRTPGESRLVSAYVESASGTVLVDAETGTPYVANVSAELVHADSWADVLRYELLHPDFRIDVSYRADLNGSVGETPAWVTETRWNESATN